MTAQDRKSIDSVRSDFPLVSGASGGGGKLAYLDNAATTQKPACVLDAMDAYYRTENANPHRSGHRLGAAATNAYEEARRTVAGFIGADEDEVVFASGATHALNTAAFCWAAAHLRPGDEIVLGIMEHHSNLVPWQIVSKQTGAKLVYLLCDKAGRVTDEAIERAIGPKTRLVAVAYVSNVLGAVAPAERIVRAAHERGAVVVLDCAQSVAHLPLDVHALDVDFAAFSGHKMYGPMGIGVLYGKPELLDSMTPFAYGGGMIDDVFEQGSTFGGVPARFEAGTQNVAGAVGLAAAVRYLETLGFDVVQAHEQELVLRMLEGLSSMKHVKRYAAPLGGDPAERCGIVAFNVRGIDAADVAHVLDRRSVAIRAGAHCAHPLMRHLGTRSLCRASIGVYNTERDVDAFLEAVEAAPADAVVAIADKMH